MIVAVTARILLVAVVIAATVTLIAVGAAVALVASLDHAARRRLARHDAALEARSRA